MKRLAAIVGLLLILPSVASADSFSATFAGTGLGTGVQGSVNGSPFSVWAGQIKWDVGLDDLLTTFCVDLKRTLTYTQELESEIPSDINSDTARKIAFLVAANFPNVATPWASAGLQLAIWEVLYDSDFSVNQKAGSTFYTTYQNSASTKANEYLQTLYLATLEGPLTGNAWFLNVVAPSGQDSSTGQDQVTAVPEPATLLLLGAGAALLGTRRRLRRAS